MKVFRMVFGFILVAATSLSLYSIPVHAVSYDLIAPSGTLTRGQDVQFIVNIDSESTAVSNATIGMTYESQYLQYVSTTPGDAMTSVTVTPSGTGTLLLSGANTSGFNGAGVFAYVTFKIVAEAPGTAELCALFAPSSTPAPVPTTPPAAPTALPVTGTVENTQLVTVLGAVLLLSSIASLTILKRARSSYSPKKIK